MKAPLNRGGLLLVALLCLTPLGAPAAKAPKPKEPPPATLKVSGYGLLGNRRLKRMLLRMETGKKRPEYFDATFIEDSALLLSGHLKRAGYLEPRIVIRLTLADGGRLETTAQALVDTPLPRPLQVKRAVFNIDAGVLYHYKELDFAGLETISVKQARSYFMETDTLFHSKRTRLYTPERLDRGLSSLATALERQGYQEVKAEATHLQRNDKTGAVNVRIRVQQGSKFLVRSVKEEIYYPEAPEPAKTRTWYLDRPYSRFWAEDFSLSLRTNEYRQGYPDVTVELRTLRRRLEEDRVLMDLLATVKTGPKVRIGAVEFQGEKRTRKGFLSRRVRIQRGELLNPIRAEAGRFRLADLGIFDKVDLRYENVNEHTRNVIYDVKEGKALNVSLLAGWGSYELLRGGVIVARNNTLGLADQAELKAVQSFKSSSGDFRYTVPDAVGNDIDLFVQGSGLRREEVDFTRLEYGGGLGAHKYFQPSATDVSLHYNYQILSALDTMPEIASVGLTNPAVGSITADVKFDRRDSPLYPRRGYKVFTTVESATQYLGGEANYERIELSPSWYHSLGGGRYLSLGVSHGTVVSFGSAAQNLPFNKRFFPGGADSIRGYQQGEASPRNAQGQYVGAETYTLATVQLEQALTPKWSVILFSDSLGFAQNLDHWPMDTALFSVGVGIWWRTLIGPVRLEYGYNLNPRPGDPSGTIQFSLGFPF
jgi:outer membrane protein insertion porin family